jgi:hypothetical protein
VLLTMQLSPNEAPSRPGVLACRGAEAIGHTPHIHGWELKSGGTTSGTNGSATQNFDAVVIGAGSGELY